MSVNSRRSTDTVEKMVKALKKTNVCRDYVRNICTRGANCKYTHPLKYVFCWDYQNGKCKRTGCAFIHCSREDEEHYNQFGELPPHLLEVQQIQGDIVRSNGDRSLCKCRPNIQGHVHLEIEPLQKRRRFEPEPILIQEKPWSFEEENAYLRNVIECLKKKVDDLQATNEFLLEQNARMRISDKSGGLTAVTVPAVTITNAAQLQPQTIRTVTASVATVPVSIATVAGTPVSIATVSMAPVHIPAPSVTMAQPQEQTSVSQTLLSTTGPLVSYPIVARPVMPNLTH